jgi:hypothetical protein
MGLETGPRATRLLEGDIDARQIRTIGEFKSPGNDPG